MHSEDMLSIAKRSEVKLVIREFKIDKKLKNTELYAEDIMRSEGYKYKKVNTGDGHPDYKVANDKETKLIEIKRNNDGLGYRQLKWIINNQVPIEIWHFEDKA